MLAGSRQAAFALPHSEADFLLTTLLRTLSALGICGNNAAMRPHYAIFALTTLLLGSCAPKTDGSAACTRHVVGAGNGWARIKTTIFIPEEFENLGEIRNRGVFLLAEDCDYGLDATLSDDTIHNLINRASEFPLFHKGSNSHVATADLIVLKYSDGKAFFVVRVNHLDTLVHIPSYMDPKKFVFRKEAK